MGKGLIAKIERYAIYDGPGIRTLIFMKGCPMRCIWCSSPQTQNSYPEVVYCSERCIGCYDCINLCPENAISISSSGKVNIDRVLCTNCGDCTQICPTEALKLVGEFMSIEQVMIEILKDKAFYERSGGGVTISGGEPLMQAEFVNDLLCECHRYSIHTAIETAGFAEWKAFETIRNCIDLLFFDIKIVDTKKHKELTGVSNKKILENIRRVDEEWNLPVILRFPLVPGINDSENDLNKLSEFVSSLKRIDTLEILPYHRLGEYEYATLGREYKLKDVEIPDDSYLKKIRNFLGEHIPKVKVSRLEQK